MELTPDLLLEAKFAAARRGYDMGEVDDFLERCAEGLDVLLLRLRAEFDRAEQAEAEVARLRGGGDGAEPDSAPDVAPDEVNGDMADELYDAPAADAVGEPMRILIHAERTAEAAIAEARADAERIRTEAESVASTQRSEAETLLERARAEAEAEARRAGDEARAAVHGEVATLQQNRDGLAEDIALLQTWLDDQRGRLRSTAHDLQRLADDPNALREIAAPAISDAPGDAAPDHDATSRDDESDDDGDGDGEPTQAVPVFGRPFDDDPDDVDRRPET
ncbi:MAG: DivIVA domain-containing protein [Acidimicrobiales bacterium]